MNEKYIFIAIIVVIIFVATALLLILKNSNNTTIIINKKQNKKPTTYKKNFNIKDMTEIAANRNSSEEELKKAVNYVKKNLPFPKKTNYKLPKDIKIYLNFVLLIASHKNADATLIAYMDRELKKANPHYNTEIDIYENEGLKERSNRI